MPNSAMAIVSVALLAAVSVVIDIRPDTVLASDPVGFAPVEPGREVDTRVGRGGQRLVGGDERFVPLPSVPVHADAVTVNVTVVDADADGYVTVTDCRGGATTSAVNYVRGRVAANQVTVGLAGDIERGLCVTSSSSTHLIVDLFGFSTGEHSAAFVPTSVREHDTRSMGGIDPSGVLTIDVGRHAVSAPLVAWSGTVTATDVRDPGFVTVYPCAAERPVVSSLNLVPGITAANQVTVQVPTDDPRVCLYREGAAELVVDTTGVWRHDGSQTFSPASPPVRIIDSRAGDRVRSEEVRRLHEPADVVLFVNVTATRSLGDGWLALFPCGSGYQGTSTLNLIRGEDVSSAAVVGAADDGVCMTASVGTDVVVDVFGVQHGAGSTPPLDPGVPLTGTVVRAGLVDDPSVPQIGPCVDGPLDAFDGARASIGLPALVSDQRTRAFACDWATEMARTANLVHSTPERRLVIDACGVTGENIAEGGDTWTWMPDAWLASPRHLEVVVSSLLTRGSIAYVERTVSGRSRWYGVAAFGGAC